MTRRDFCKGAGALTAAGLAVPALALGKREPIWGGLFHIGCNMWNDHCTFDPATMPHKWKTQRLGPPSEIQVDDRCYREVTARMAERGMNLIVLDLGEGVVFPSHPELAVKDAWTPDRVRDEVRRLRQAGIEAVPKINFSTTHDTWMGDFGRMVSTKPYYDFCADIIRDADEMFLHPRFIHLGYDEEAYWCQRRYDYSVVREGELWWHDFFYIVNEVEKRGMRGMMWADVLWTERHHDEYLRRCPKSLIQTNWYYSKGFDLEKMRVEKERKVGSKENVQMYEYDQVKAYLDLDRAGFDQIPCGGNWREDENFRNLVDFCRTRFEKPEHLLGFMTAPWVRMIPEFHKYNLDAIDQVGEVIARG